MPNLMKTHQLRESAPLFPQMVSVALGGLKKRLQLRYQKAYPDSDEIIELVLDEEEAKAWEISVFPHLILPDLVDARIARLALQPGQTHPATTGLSPKFTTTETPKSGFAVCG
jgi:hypothetical protein